VESRPELLAHHRTEAGELEPALHAWRQAAEVAILRSAGSEAHAHLKQALRLMQALPETAERRTQELELLNVLALLQMDDQGFGSSALEQTSLRALELSRQTELPLAQRLHYCKVLIANLIMTARFQEAEELMRQLLATEQQEAALRTEGYRVKGFLALMRGQLSLAERDLKQMRQLAWHQGKRQEGFAASMWIDPRVDAQVLLLHAQVMRGQLQEAREGSRALQELLRTERSSPNMAYGWVYQATACQMLREVRATLHAAEESVRFCSGNWIRPLQVTAVALRGWARVHLGQADEGLDSLRSALDMMRQGGERVILPYCLGLLMDAHLLLGQWREGLAVVDEALRVAKASGIRFGVAEVYRLQGELLRVAGREEEALRCFLRARAFARWEQAGLMELRATVSLARLLRDRGCPEQARRRLEQSYARLTPDPDSVDLCEARVLLDACAQ
jgi:tetratricopeptide (TPR) repeat protein